MRKFLVYIKEKEKVTVLGLVESDEFPSTILNNKEYAEREFGYRNPYVREITEKCFIKLN